MTAMALDQSAPPFLAEHGLRGRRRIVEPA
jgi:hypothetical protein